MTQSADGAVSSRIPVAAWWILILMTVDSILGMIDRNAVSVLKPTLKQVFSISDSQYGLLVTAFMVPFALFYVLTGRWVDRYGSRITLTLFVTIWSLATIAAGFAQSFPQLLFWRAVLGAAEAGLLPASMIALITWFPRERLATVYAIKNPLQALGPILTPPIVAFLALSYGWRSAFVIPGVLGLIFAYLWWRADRNPPTYPVSAAQAETEADTTVWTIRAVLAHRAIWGVLLFRVISDPVWFFFQYWQAGYLQEVIGSSLADAGRLLWIPPAINAVTTFATAAWSDRLVRSGRSGGSARLKVMYAVVPLALLIAVLPFVRSTWSVLAIFTTTYILSYTWLYLSNILITELFPRRAVGTAVGLVNCVGTAGAALFNLAAGPVIDAYGYAPVFFACAALHPLAAAVAWYFYGRAGSANAPPKNSHSDTSETSTPAAESSAR